MRFLNLIVCSILLSVFALNLQAEIQVNNQSDDAPRVLDLNEHKLTAHLILASPGFDLHILNQDQSREIVYRPNLASTTGVSLDYKDLIGISVAFRGDVAPSPDNPKGDTNYDDFRFSFDYKNFLIESSYQRYHGLFISNSNSLSSTYSNYVVLPNMSLSHIATSVLWVKNPKRFSHHAALSRTERQIKSGGSWLFGGSLAQTRVENSESFIPSLIKTDFGLYRDIQYNRYASLCAVAAYAYTVAWTEKIFSSLALGFGLGPGFSHFEDALHEYNSSYISYHVKAKIIIAYNGDQFISGIGLDTESTSAIADSISFSSNPSLFYLFFGTRFY